CGSMVATNNPGRQSSPFQHKLTKAVQLHYRLSGFVRWHCLASDGKADIFSKRLTVEERALLDADPKQISRPKDLLEAMKGMKKIAAHSCSYIEFGENLSTDRLSPQKADYSTEENPHAKGGN
ncbi:MAG: hypothetical protein OEU92_04840, partial [Alphaproteobacteria bacterium]|nr:hypothetical protein [Alphaproteobacteria bacterium]